MDISVLVYIFLIIAFAKTLGELVTRVNQPAIVGELLAGIILGPFVFGAFIDELQSMYKDEFIKNLADLGILLLLLYFGLEFSFKRILKSFRIGIVIAIGGMLVPAILGIFLGLAYDFQQNALLFIAIAVSVTALPVTIKILKDMEVIQTETSSRIISAAMITDVSLLIAMAVAIATPTDHQWSDRALILFMGFALFFFLVFLTSHYVIPQLYRVLIWMRTGEAAFVIAIGIAMGFAILASLVGLPDFIGAFIAGMMLRESGSGLKAWAHVEDILSGITQGFLAPIFFVLIGFTVNFNALFFTSSSIVLFFILIILITVPGKLLGGVIFARIAHLKKNEAYAIGSIMIGKGEMELVFANIAFESGLIGEDIFSALILMAFISTIIAPILFRHYFNKAVVANEIVRVSVKEENMLTPD